MSRTLQDPQSTRTQHGFHASVVGGPPVRAVSGKLMFKERHFRPAPFEQYVPAVDVKSRCGRVHLLTGYRESLKQQELAHFPHCGVQSEQWVPQMVKNPHKED